jgi:acyl-CoA reductase-like NAD-dependent aldehyde dehydrogenase
MQAAVAHLTPVTLELGGKSPALVDKNANLCVAAHRIAQGKFFNAGQTCVAPDYVLAQESILDKLVSELVKAVREFYGEDPRQSEEYARIINTKQFDTLVNYFSSGEIICGGQSNRDERYIAPTILKNVSPEAPVMQCEIFGPILPVLPVKDMDEALQFVQKREKPLAFYVFSENKGTVEKVLAVSTSGGRPRPAVRRGGKQRDGQIPRRMGLPRILQRPCCAESCHQLRPIPALPALRWR